MAGKDADQKADEQEESKQRVLDLTFHVCMGDPQIMSKSQSAVLHSSLYI
jgi:hypothetical protein